MCQITWEQADRLLPLSQRLCSEEAAPPTQSERYKVKISYCPVQVSPRTQLQKKAVPLAQQAAESSAPSIGTGKRFLDKVGTVPQRMHNVSYFIFRKFNNLPTFNVLVFQCPHVHIASERDVSPLQSFCIVKA